jgi:hypothetical protein
MLISELKDKIAELPDNAPVEILLSLQIGPEGNSETKAFEPCLAFEQGIGLSIVVGKAILIN